MQMVWKTSLDQLQTLRDKCLRGQMRNKGRTIGNITVSCARLLIQTHKLKNSHYNPNSQNLCPKWIAFWEKSDPNKYEKVEGTPGEQKARVNALYKMSARVCDCPVDDDGNPIPPSRQSKGYRHKTPKEWLIEDLLEVHAEYNRGPEGQM